MFDAGLFAQIACIWEATARKPGNVHRYHDFADTAALLDVLDLLISVDTSVVHLAGALARPVWTLLAAGPDWRWMLDREGSPWYPTMRLFRQPSPGAWQPMMERVAAELRKIVEQRREPA